MGRVLYAARIPLTMFVYHNYRTNEECDSNDNDNDISHN